MNIFLFEWKKLFFSRRFLFTLVILGIIIIGFFLRNFVFQELVIEEQEQQITTYTQEAQKFLNGLQLQVTNNPEDDVSAEQLKLLWRALESLYELRPLISSEDWQLRLQTENAFLLALLEYKESGGDFSLNSSEIMHKVAFNKKLLEHGIKPEPENYSVALPNFLKQMTSLYVNLGAILILLLLIGDILTSEFEQGSIKFLYTQPLKKTSILHSKWITAGLAYLLITFVLYFVSWIIGLLFGKDGTFAYPVMMEHLGSYKFITIGQYIQWSLLGTTVSALLVISICLYISLITKHSIITLFTTIVLLVGGYFAMQVIPWDVKSWFNPFQFVFAGVTVQTDGELWYQGIPVILLLTFVIYFFSLLSINKVIIKNGR